MDNLPSNATGSGLPPAIRANRLRAPAQLAVKLSVPAAVLILVSALIAAAAMYLAARNHVLDVAARNAEQRAASTASSLAATHDRVVAHMQALMSEPIQRHLAPSSRTRRALAEIFSRHIREHPEITAIFLTDTGGSVITERQMSSTDVQDFSFLLESPPGLPRSVSTRAWGENTLLLTSPVYRDETTLAGHVVMAIDTRTLFRNTLTAFASSTEHPEAATCDAACHTESELLRIGFPMIATGSGTPLGAPESVSRQTVRSIAAHAAAYGAPGATTLADIPGMNPGLRAAVHGTTLQNLPIIAVVVDHAGHHLETLNRTWFTLVGLACLLTLIISIAYLFVIEHLIAPIRRVVLHAHQVVAGSARDLDDDTGLKEADELLWALRELSSRAAIPAIGNAPETAAPDRLASGIDELLESIESTTELSVNLAVRLQGLSSLDGFDPLEMDRTEVITALGRLDEDISLIRESADETAHATARIADSVTLQDSMSETCDLHPRVMALLHSVDHVIEGSEALRRHLDAAMQAMHGDDDARTVMDTLSGEVEHMRSIAESIFDTVVSTADEVCRLSADIQYLTHPETGHR